MPPINQPSNPNVPSGVPEQSASKPGVEALPQAPIAPEVASQTNSAGSSGTQQIPNPQPVQLPAAPPVPAPGATVRSNTNPAPGVGPGIADDVDLIEKEWVDQADKIVEQTKTDPYAEEEAIESLQIDYLKKRYGHDVKKSDNQGGV